MILNIVKNFHHLARLVSDEVSFAYYLWPPNTLSSLQTSLKLCLCPVIGNSKSTTTKQKIITKRASVWDQVQLHKQRLAALRMLMWSRQEISLSCILAFKAVTVQHIRCLFMQRAKLYSLRTTAIYYYDGLYFVGRMISKMNIV